MALAVATPRVRGLVSIVIVLSTLVGRVEAHRFAERALRAGHRARVVSARAQARENKLLAFAARIAPHKFRDTGPLGPNRVTEERPFLETKGAIFGVEVGVTLSELHQVRAKEGVELVHVVAPDGSTNLELVLARRGIGHGQRVELQGPALNTSRSPGSSPVGVRFVGVGLTGDLVDPQSKEVVSYTAEVKLTERTLIEAGRVFAPALVGSVARLASSQGAHVIANVLGGAVPIISTALAVSSARWAWKVAHDPARSRFEKGTAMAHAGADAVRIVLPLAGTVANAGLVVASSAVSLIKVLRLKRAIRAGGLAALGIERPHGGGAPAVAVVEPDDAVAVGEDPQGLELPRQELDRRPAVAR